MPSILIAVLLSSFSAAVSAAPVLEPQACNVLLDPSYAHFYPSMENPSLTHKQEHSLHA